MERSVPFWEEEILPLVKAGKRVLVVCHGNPLRGLAKHLDGLTDEEVMDLEVPTGKDLTPHCLYVS